MDYRFQWGVVWRDLPALLQGAGITFAYALVALIAGIVCALGLALARGSDQRVLRAGATVWIEGARNTPALFQIYVLYFGLGSFGIYIGSGAALILGIIFNNAGYLAETFRGCLRAIPQTQWRAARSLGMGAGLAFRSVVLPQLLRICYPPITSQFVWSMLMTSLGLIVGVNSDLMGVAQDLNVRSFRSLEIFLTAAVLYYLMVVLVTAAARLLGRRLFRY